MLFSTSVPLQSIDAKINVQALFWSVQEVGNTKKKAF